MPQVQVTEHHELYKIIDDLCEENVDKVLSYAAFLRHTERLEDEEDIKKYFERVNEPTYTLEEVKRGLEIG